MGQTSDITPVEHRVSLAERERRSGHLGGVIWLTGISGAGKSTLAFALEERLFRAGFQVAVLDGDNVRTGLNADLGFSHADRTENVRRVGHVSALLAALGCVCVSAFISPYRADREMARRAVAERMSAQRFFEVYVRADLATCEQRDPKGLYRKARAGRIKGFTAVDDAYEPPVEPALVIDTTHDTVAESLARLADFVQGHLGAAPVAPAVQAGRV